MNSLRVVAGIWYRWKAKRNSSENKLTSVTKQTRWKFSSVTRFSIFFFVRQMFFAKGGAKCSLKCFNRKIINGSKRSNLCIPRKKIKIVLKVEILGCLFSPKLISLGQILGEVWHLGKKYFKFGDFLLNIWSHLIFSSINHRSTISMLSNTIEAAEFVEFLIHFWRLSWLKLLKFD